MNGGGGRAGDCGWSWRGEVGGALGSPLGSMTREQTEWHMRVMQLTDRSIKLSTRPQRSILMMQMHSHIPFSSISRQVDIPVSRLYRREDKSLCDVVARKSTVTSLSTHSIARSLTHATISSLLNADVNSSQLLMHTSYSLYQACEHGVGL